MHFDHFQKLDRTKQNGISYRESVSMMTFFSVTLCIPSNSLSEAFSLPVPPMQRVTIHQGPQKGKLLGPGIVEKPMAHVFHMISVHYQIGGHTTACAIKHRVISRHFEALATAQD